MAIAEKLQSILTYKANIKAALEGKGAAITNDISKWADAINDLSTGSSEVTYYEYLVGNGTSYILTDYTPNTNTIIEVKFKYNKPSLSFVPVVGSRSGYSSAGCLLALTNTAGAMRADLSNNTGTISSIGSEDDVLTVKADVGQNKVYINGTEKTFSSSSATNGSWYKLALFTMNTAGTIYTNVFSGNIYYVKIWEGTELKAEYKPAIYNKQKGMHDTVSDTFYTSANDTQFEVGGNIIGTSGGNSVVAVNHKLQVYEYITSSGGYINTDIILSGNTTLNVDILKTSTGDIRQVVLGASRNSSGHGTVIVTKANAIYSGVNSTSTNSTIVNANIKTTITESGNVDSTYGTQPLMIFAAPKGTDIDASSTILYNIYKIEILSNSNTIHSLIPCKYDDAIGMFDTVTSKFYGVSNSGTLTLGGSHTNVINLNVNTIDGLTSDEFATIKSDIQTAITNKGVDASDAGWNEFADKIGDIQTFDDSSWSGTETQYTALTEKTKEIYFITE